jgi:NTP pyrophosphatase (non-canonical NTP hydrolase)
MEIRDFQNLINKMYSDKDRQRGPAGTFLWLMEEIGELASAIGDRDKKEEKAKEFADVFAWLVTLANVEDIDLEQAVAEKYGRGCPGCGKLVCTCKDKL